MCCSDKTDEPTMEPISTPTSAPLPPANISCPVNQDACTEANEYGSCGYELIPDKLYACRNEWGNAGRYLYASFNVYFIIYRNVNIITQTIIFN